MITTTFGNQVEILGICINNPRMVWVKLLARPREHHRIMDIRKLKASGGWKELDQALRKVGG